MQETNTVRYEGEKHYKSFLKVAKRRIIDILTGYDGEPKPAKMLRTGMISQRSQTQRNDTSATHNYSARHQLLLTAPTIQIGYSYCEASMKISSRI